MPTRQEIEEYAREVARRNGIDEDLFLRLIQAESSFDQGVVSHAGAIGLTQLMPGTARELGVDPTDWRQNLEGGARYFADRLRQFNGHIPMALSGYNRGPGATERAGRVHPNRETMQYVTRILGDDWQEVYGVSPRGDRARVPSAEARTSGIMATPQGQDAARAVVEDPVASSVAQQIQNQAPAPAPEAPPEEEPGMFAQWWDNVQENLGIGGDSGRGWSLSNIPENLGFGSREARSERRAEEFAARQGRLDELHASGEISDETYQSMTEQLILDREFGGDDRPGMGLAGIMQYLDLAQPQYPSRLPTTIERGTPGSGTRAIQRLGIRPLV